MGIKTVDMRDHWGNPPQKGDCQWHCDQTSRCVRYEWDANALRCELFQKPGLIDSFDLRDHWRKPAQKGDCEWKCNQDSRCVGYEWDATTLRCELFEKAQ